MSIDEVVRAWKGDDDQDGQDKDEQDKDKQVPQNPAGKELSDEELEEAAGGMGCNRTCPPDTTCGGYTCTASV